MRRLRALPWKKIVFLGGPSVLLLLVLTFVVVYLRTDIPTPSAGSQAQSTVIRYAGGEELARIGTNRQLVGLPDVSDAAQKAVLAAEDRRFYSEPGISPRGIARALLTNIRGGGGVQQGGSTITQQYAKNAFLTSQRTYARKVKEVFIALKMTRERSKEQILADYLNTIYFGRGAYGIQAASRAYFGSEASAATLTPAQAAVLASSIRSPSGYDPAKHPEAAQQRWAYVLDGMVSQGWLSAADRTAATYPKTVAPGAGTVGADLSGPAGHVVDAVQEELARRGFTEAAVNAGGLTVTTTLDQKAQAAAVAAVRAVDKGDRSDTALQGALVSVVPGDGAVRAYYGGANGSGLDYAGGIAPGGAVVHQPGSSMKPYVLVTALQKGISLSSTYDGSSPQTISGQLVRNAGNEQGGRTDLVTATADSINTVFFRLAVDVGPAKVAATAHAAGIPDDVKLANPQTGAVEGGIALGQYEVHVTDQAVGYATFAAQGVETAPYLVSKVLRGTRMEYTANPQTRRAFAADVSADATYAMQQVVLSGTGTRARLAGGRPSAGKTGTTDNSNNVWFCGFTPQLSTAVWFGYGDPRRSVPGVNGRDSSGGAISAPVWKAYMDAALQGQPEQPLPRRAGVGRSTGGGPVPTRSQPAVTPGPTTTTPGPTTPGATTPPAPTTPAPSPTVTPSPTATSPRPRPRPRPTTPAPTPTLAPPPAVPERRR